MARLLPLAQVRLLAAGTLPDRPRSRPMAFMADGAGTGCPATTRLTTWRRLQALADQAPIAARLFDRDSPDATAVGSDLHAARLREDWDRLCQAVNAPLLVYLHRGHQAETHSPILQHLLRLLDHRGPVHALRVETRDAFRDAMVMARALAARSGLALVLSDPTERLTTGTAPPRRLRFALLGTAQALPDSAQVALPRDPSVSFFQMRL